MKMFDRCRLGIYVISYDFHSLDSVNCNIDF